MRKSLRSGTASRTSFLCFILASAAVEAKLTWPGCPDVTDREFRYVKVVTKQTDPTLDEPVKMAFDLLADNKVDIYFVERHGKVKRYDAAANTVSVIGTLDVYSDSPDRATRTGPTENGLSGIALDPGFKRNRWLYLFYAPWQPDVFRVSRFTLVDGKMDPASEKILFSIPAARMYAGTEILLPGGVLSFDLYGDLWIALGANSKLYPALSEADRNQSAEASSSNLADLRGAILRVHPDASERGYGIPAGNFGEYWSAQFAQQGKADLAKEYADPAKVRPEIYVKGTRDPYSLSVDPVRRWVVWGDFGPNGGAPQKVEEQNLATHPSFAGYPYWVGKNVFILSGMKGAVPYIDNPAAPANESKWNQGPRRLPPAEPALFSYTANSTFMKGVYPTSGPIYRYDGALASTVKFPPHFEKAWLVAERAPGFKVLQVNEAGDKIVDSLAFLTGQAFQTPLDFKQGPEGALYMLDYGMGWHTSQGDTHIGRFEYTGSCLPPEPRLPVKGLAGRLERKAPGLRADARFLFVEAPGDYRLVIRDLRGRELRSVRGKGHGEYSLRAMLPGNRGVYLAALETGGNRRVLKLTGL